MILALLLSLFSAWIILLWGAFAALNDDDDAEYITLSEWYRREAEEDEH